MTFSYRRFNILGIMILAANDDQTFHPTNDEKLRVPDKTQIPRAKKGPSPPANIPGTFPPSPADCSNSLGRRSPRESIPRRSYQAGTGSKYPESSLETFHACIHGGAIEVQLGKTQQHV